jgi:hypothetical protein
MSKFQTKIIEEYQAKGYLVLKTIRLNVNGYPDLICTKPTEPTIFIEIKEAKDTLKPLQKLRIDQLNELGFVAFCLQNGKGKIYPDEKVKEVLNF